MKNKITGTFDKSNPYKKWDQVLFFAGVIYIM